MIIRAFHTDKFTVKVETQPEYDLDISWDDSGEVKRKLETGEFVSFCVKASVTYRGREIATDYLGNCIHGHPREFMDHRGMNAGGHGSYFSDMVRTVISEAREALYNMQRVKLRK